MLVQDEYFSCSSSDDYDSARSGDSSILDAKPLDERLLSVLGKHSNFLSLVHINAQSIPAHYIDLLTSFSPGVVDCILVSETWLKPSLPSTSYSIPGYKLFRNDRVGVGGGGVGIYLRSHIPANVICASQSQYAGSLEYLFLTIDIHGKKTLLGVVYSPNDKVDYFGTLEGVLENLVLLHDHVTIIGDLNTCLLKAGSRADRLMEIISFLNLNVVNVVEPTHYFPNCKPSLLDLAIVSEPHLVMTYGQLTSPFSYHDLIYMSFGVRPPKFKGKVQLLRNFRSLDLERLGVDVKLIDWSPLFLSDSIDDMVGFFENKLINLYDVHAPVRRVRRKHLPAPWMTPQIKRIRARRDGAKSLYRQDRSQRNLDAYKKLRNICNRACRDAKRRFVHTTIQNLGHGQTWSFLRSLGVGRSISPYQNNFDLNELNAHFSAPPLILDPDIKSMSLNSLSCSAVPDCSPFVFEPVSDEVVARSIRSIKTKAIGSDNLSLDMILPVLDDVVPVITHIINFSLSHNVFPTQWKKAFVIPVPKTPNPSSFSQYRPISILPILSKVLESVAHRQLYSFISFSNLLCPFQSGFRPSHSTVGALLNVTEDIRVAMDNTKLTVIVLLDFSSAFNSVDYDILLGSLEAIGISPAAVDWFRSYLVGRRQCVRIDEASSDWSFLNAGVPQGGVLSPLLFSIFINGIANVLSCSFHLYADDLQLYRHFFVSEVSDAIAALNADLSAVEAWARSFGLLVNPAKSQAIIMGSSRLRARLDWASMPYLYYSGIPIGFTEKAVNLGVTMDSTMSWVPHVNGVSKRMHCAFHSLKRLQFFLPMETKIMLAQSLLLPILDYADVCYLDVTEELLDKLERLQNLAIRFIFGLRKYDHISEFRAKLKWLPIRLRRDVHILSVLYNILNDPNYPTYLRSRFKLLPPPARPRRPGITTVLELPSGKTNFLFNSFSWRAAHMWNHLPTHVQDSPSIHSFKKRLKLHFLSTLTP